MLKPLLWKACSKDQKKCLLSRPSKDSSLLKQRVKDLIKDVREKGDEALYALTAQFDKVQLQSLIVSKNEWERALAQIEPRVLQAFLRVISQLSAFHERQSRPNEALETSPGIRCERLIIPLERIGLYVPAGTAPLVSTVFMLGVPAMLAGCPLRILCTPANQEGKVDPHLLFAASLCGIEQVFKVGGAQAIAAMAYGSESIPKVDKIFGPGNAWVTMAKMLVSLDADGAAMDMPAGPSEVLVVADAQANPAFVASDLLSQAEHGQDSQVVLLCMSENFAERVNFELVRQLKGLSRAQIVLQALQESRCLIVEGMMDAMDIVNDYAPEHLILQVDEARDYLPFIRKAGSVFLGPWSPESVGDYASGTNHVLPTAGFARAYSGLSLEDFTRSMSVQELSPDGLSSIAETIRVLTDIEGLDAHQKAIDIRLQALGGKA